MFKYRFVVMDKDRETNITTDRNACRCRLKPNVFHTATMHMVQFYLAYLIYSQQLMISSIETESIMTMTYRSIVKCELLGCLSFDYYHKLFVLVNVTVKIIQRTDIVTVICINSF